MFLRIEKSDQIVNKLGRLKFHNFLNDFVYDITRSILAHRV